MGKPEVKRRAVFLDRDGVLNLPTIRNGLPYPPTNRSEFELYDDVSDGCTRLKSAGFVIVVITNQPDVGRGTQTEENVEAFHEALKSAIPAIDRIEVCYHGGESLGQPCACRKPKPGMLFRAAAALNIDLKASYMIGDRWRDVNCAQAANCRAVFIDRGYSEALREQPDFVTRSFGDAVEAVLRDARAPLHSFHR